MTGQATVRLAHDIQRARATANEATVVMGPDSYAARKAKAVYNDLRARARRLFNS